MKLKLLVCLLLSVVLFSCTKDPDLFSYLTAGQEDEEVVADAPDEESEETESESENSETSEEGTDNSEANEGESSSSSEQSESSSEESTQTDETGSDGESTSSESESSTEENTENIGDGSTNEEDTPTEENTTEENTTEQGGQEETPVDENGNNNEETTPDEEPVEEIPVEVDNTRIYGEWVLSEIRYDANDPNSASLNLTNSIVRNLNSESCYVVEMSFNEDASSIIKSKFNYLEVVFGPQGFYYPCPDKVDSVPQSYELTTDDVLTVMLFNIYQNKIPVAFEGPDTLILEGAEVVLVLNGSSLFNPEDYTDTRAVFVRK